MRTALLTILLATALVLGAGSARAQNLYWLDTNFGAPALYRSDADGLGVTGVSLPAGSLPEGLAASGGGSLYWAESTISNAAVKRAASDLSNVQTVLGGGSALRGIAVDDVAQMIYWTSSNLATGPKVHRSTFSGAGAAVLVALPSSANPRGIAVDHAGGSIYWADFDRDAIYSANLDGTVPTLWLPLSPGSGPYGVALGPGGFLYWTEYNTGQLRRVSLSNFSVTTLLTGLLNPTYLTIDASGNRVYWAEGGVGAQHLRRWSLSGGSVVTLPAPLTTYGGIAFRSSGTTEVIEEDTPPAEFAIERVWPNPGPGSARVAFTLPKSARIRLSVLDVQGRQVAVLEDGVLPAGRYERSWTGRTRSHDAPAGVYFVRLSAEGRSWIRRWVLTR